MSAFATTRNRRQQWRRAKEPIEVRFLRKVVYAENGCWVWQGSCAINGYGQFTWESGKRQVVAHRAAYELFVGPIPHGLVLDHLCRNRACVNPKHLEPVTLFENSRRANLNQSRPLATHCKRGHEYTTETTWVRKNGRRHCRICARETNRRAQARHRAQSDPKSGKYLRAIHAVIRDEGPITKRAIQARLGTNYQTVCRNLEKLLLAKVVRESGKVQVWKGPISSLYELVEKPRASNAEGDAEKMPAASQSPHAPFQTGAQAEGMPTIKKEAA